MARLPKSSCFNFFLIAAVVAVLALIVFNRVRVREFQYGLITGLRSAPHEAIRLGTSSNVGSSPCLALSKIKDPNVSIKIEISTAANDSQLINSVDCGDLDCAVVELTQAVKSIPYGSNLQILFPCYTMKEQYNLVALKDHSGKFNSLAYNSGSSAEYAAVKLQSEDSTLFGSSCRRVGLDISNQFPDVIKTGEVEAALVPASVQIPKELKVCKKLKENDVCYVMIARSAQKTPLTVKQKEQLAYLWFSSVAKLSSGDPMQKGLILKASRDSASLAQALNEGTVRYFSHTEAQAYLADKSNKSRVSKLINDWSMADAYDFPHEGAEGYSIDDLFYQGALPVADSALVSESADDEASTSGKADVVKSNKTDSDPQDSSADPSLPEEKSSPKAIRPSMQNQSETNPKRLPVNKQKPNKVVRARRAGAPGRTTSDEGISD